MEFTSPAPGHDQGSEPRDGLRLFVFPHAGGSSLTYQDWPDRFPVGWQVRALDAPGHGPLLDAAPLTDGNALIGHFFDRLVPELSANGTPFAFFGHSMGALVAYELTRRLLAEGAPAPVWLGVSACGAPRGHTDEPTPPHPGELSDAELRRTLAALGGTPAQVLRTEELWQVFAPAIRADLTLLRTWRPAPPAAPLPVALSAFAGTRDAAALPARVASWAEHTEHFLGLHVFDGGHFYFQDGPDAAARLAGRVTADVRGALRSGRAAAGLR
ncbi:alpha/beta fold hydrolase [Streptomyces sp. NPDC004542]|uniref:thioesterase II family protein n=1 Tax=Streptomyces sp. NPDC004542 TaxID=3154281 RepID=UPI00339DFE75